MTKPTRLAAKANRAEHERPTRPAPAFTACRVAAERELRLEPQRCLEQMTRRYRHADGLRATLSIDPTTQAELLTLSAALTAPRAPRVPSFPMPAPDAIELEVDSLFADLGAE